MASVTQHVRGGTPLFTSNVSGYEGEYWAVPKDDGGRDYYRVGGGGDSYLVGEPDVVRAGAGAYNPQNYWDAGQGGATYDTGTDGNAAQIRDIRSGLVRARSGAAEAGSLSRQKYMSGIRNFVTGLGNQQEDIDERGIQNELSKQQARSGILGMVGRGVRSSGVMLAGRNAGDSSAAGALANVYGGIGQRESVKADQQYQLGNRAIGKEQERFEEGRTSGVRDFRDQIDQAVLSIVSSATQELASLDSQRQSLSLPEQFDIDKQKALIKARAQEQLDGLKTLVGEEAGGVQAKTPEQRRAEAFELFQSGSAAENPFQFTDQAPLQFQNTGPATGLPIYTRPRTDEEV